MLNAEYINQSRIHQLNISISKNVCTKSFKGCILIKSQTKPFQWFVNFILFCLSNKWRHKQYSFYFDIFIFFLFFILLFSSFFIFILCVDSISQSHLATTFLTNETKIFICRTTIERINIVYYIYIYIYLPRFAIISRTRV